MKMRKVGADGQTFTVTEHEPLRHGGVVFYQSNTCPERMTTFPSGVLKMGNRYYPVRMITGPHTCLLQAICEICGRHDLVGIAWALSNFNLTLDDCQRDNPDQTSSILTEKTEFNMEGYPADQIDAVRKMADAMSDKDSALYKRVMQAVHSAQGSVH